MRAQTYRTDNTDLETLLEDPEVEGVALIGEEVIFEYSGNGDPQYDAEKSDLFIGEETVSTEGTESGYSAKVIR